MANTAVDQLINEYSAYLEDVKNTYKLPDVMIGKLFLPELVSDILAADFDSRALGLHPPSLLLKLENWEPNLCLFHIVEKLMEMVASY